MAVTAPSHPATDASSACGDDDDGQGCRGARRYAAAATVLAALPIVVAGVRGTARGWIPTGDDAYSAVRAWDVFSANPPLLGTWSSASTYTGHEINHPGPLQFDLLAAPVRVLGHDAGTSLGLTAINAVAVVLAGWLLGRRLGPVAAALGMGFGALLAWSMGSEMLYDPWSQHAPLLPFALFLVAAWCALAGDVVALPVLMAAGAYAFQTHLSYSVLVPGMTAFVLAALGVRAVLARRADPAGWPDRRRKGVRWAAVTGAAWLVCWAQPLAEQLVGGDDGNMIQLFHSADHSMRTPGWTTTLRALGGTVAVPPAWLPPSFGSPSFDVNGSGRPVPLAAGCLVALAAALAVLGWRACRRGARAVAAGAATGLVSLVLALVTTLRMPLPLGMVPTYSRWMWPLGMVVWLALAVAVVDEVRQRWAVRASRLALPGLALALVGGLAALPTVDHSKAAPRWSMDAVRALDDDVVAAVEGRGPVLVDLPYTTAIGYVGPPLYSVLQEAGIPFVVHEEHMVSQLGEDRRYQPGGARVRLTVRGGAAAEGAEDPPPGERLVASWSALSDDEVAELDELTADLRSHVAGNGVPLVEGADTMLHGAGLDRMLADVAAARTDPDRVLEGGTLIELWSGPVARFLGGPLVDREAFPADLMDRWAELADRRLTQQVRVYVAPIG